MVLPINVRNCADLIIVKGGSKQTKYQTKNSYQLTAYGAYLFRENKLFSGELKPHIFADL